MSSIDVKEYPNTWQDEAYMAANAYSGEPLEGYTRQIDGPRPERCTRPELGLQEAN